MPGNAYARNATSAKLAAHFPNNHKPTDWITDNPMRYSILTGWLLVLLLPLVIPQPAPYSISTIEAIQFPQRYLRSFQHFYQSLVILDNVPLTNRAPQQQAHAVTVWRDHNGVVHFSDPGKGPADANHQLVNVVDNSDLMTTPATGPRATHTTGLLLFMVLILGGSTLLIATAHTVIARRIASCRLSRHGVSGQANANRQADAPFARNPAPDSNSPYCILGVHPSASDEAVKQAYRNLLSRYHPDKVEHLGEDLKKAAHQKTLALNAAWQEICQSRGMQ